MLRFETSRMIAAATGRPLPPVVRIIDRALAMAGLSRSERKRLLADLRRGSKATEHTTEGAQK